MATARDLITWSMKDLGLLEQGEAPSGQEAQDVLDVFNQTLQSLIYDSVDLEFENLTLDDTVPYPDDQLSAFRALTAVNSAPMFGVIPSPIVLKQADDGKKRLAREYLDPDNLSIDDALRTIYNPNGYYVNSSNF